MIEIHNHILPDLDDGAKHMEESIALAKAAAAHGVETIIAAPRFDREGPVNPGHLIREKANALNARIQAERIPLSIIPAQQAVLHPNIAASRHRKNLLAVGRSSYLLVELPQGEPPENMKELIFQLQLENFTPIISRPECNTYIQENPEEIYKAVKNGALVQIAADSVTGRNGGKAKKFANQLIEANLVHLIASGNHQPKKQPFHLEEAYQQIEKTHSYEKAFYLQDNIQLLIQGTPIVTLQPERIKTKKLLGFL